MDGTFGGGDLISASLAIMLGGESESELHDKEVELSTSDITGSQTAVFEYDPADEDPQGDPPGPWDGYSLFTIDLSAVKDDIEALQATIAAIIAILQAHDPDYDPDETPPEDGVQGVVDEEEALEDCRDAVIAKIQEYFPSFDPQTCQDLVDKIEEDEDAREDAEEHEGFEFPPDVTLPEISELIAGEVTVSTPTSEWEIEVFLYAESYDGSVTKRVRTLHTGGESWFFRPAISFIHGDEEHVVMPMHYRYQIGPSASEWVSITGWSIDGSTTVSLSWINQDGNTRSWGGSYAGADLTPLMTGPYVVKNK